MTTKYETHEHDVLIIGAGGAGLRAAIEALAQGASVGVVCKSLLGKAHTVMAEGGIAAAMANVDHSDDWRTHFRDTMRGGKFLNHWRMAQLHAQEAPDRIRELEQWGALFDRTSDGQILQRAFGGHTYKRLCHVGDRTGLEMIRTLQDRGVSLGIDVYMECAVTRLLKDGDRVAGAFGYWREQGRFVVFRAKSVVLATGGIGKMYKVTSNSWEYTADGMALAYDAGAELKDLEFVQFHPTGMVWPPGVQGILVTEAVRGEGGILRNKLGERFMEKYDPKRMELSTRDVVARAIYTEVREGRGSEHGGAFLDISQKPAEYVKKKLPSMYHQFLELADVDITKGPDGSRTHMPLRDGRRARRSGDRCGYGARAITPPAKLPRACMARTAWEEIPFPTSSYSAGVPAWRRRNAPRSWGSRRSTMRRSPRPNERCWRRLRTQAANPPMQSIVICRTPCKSWWESSELRETFVEALGELEKLKERAKHMQRGRLPAFQSRLAFIPRSKFHADDCGGGHPQRPRPPREPRSAQPHRFPLAG